MMEKMMRSFNTRLEGLEAKYEIPNPPTPPTPRQEALKAAKQNVQQTTQPVTPPTSEQQATQPATTQQEKRKRNEKTRQQHTRRNLQPADAEQEQEHEQCTAENIVEKVNFKEQQHCQHKLSLPLPTRLPSNLIKSQLPMTAIAISMAAIRFDINP